jgi:hypothetical protein
MFANQHVLGGHLRDVAVFTTMSANAGTRQTNTNQTVPRDDPQASKALDIFVLRFLPVTTSYFFL